MSKYLVANKTQYNPNETIVFTFILPPDSPNTENISIVTLDPQTRAWIVLSDDEVSYNQIGVNQWTFSTPAPNDEGIFIYGIAQTDVIGDDLIIHGIIDTETINIPSQLLFIGGTIVSLVGLIAALMTSTDWARDRLDELVHGSDSMQTTINKKLRERKRK